MTGNRAVVYSGPRTVKVEKLNYPKLVDPRGKKCDHGVIIKLVTTNICGSDLHIYRGRFVAPAGMVLGHENTGEVVETGRDVEFIKTGDLVSVPFNVACGRCRNCRERHTDICLNVNPENPCGAYGFNLGGWQGGQAEYMMVPYADFQLLKFPDRDQAMERILDLTLLSDILPTGFHGFAEAGVGPGSTVYVAGAGPVGRCAAASALLARPASSSGTRTGNDLSWSKAPDSRPWTCPRTSRWPIRSRPSSATARWIVGWTAWGSRPMATGRTPRRTSRKPCTTP